MSKKEKIVPRLNQVLQKRSSIIILLGLIIIIGLPLRTQNIRLNGYISDDAWWHYRQIQQVVEYEHRLNPDIYEFATLNRAMTYPPLFHYVVAFSYNLYSCGLGLIKFTHYFNILEGILYILLIYLLSCSISNDRLFSLIGALGAAVSHGIIIRARAGELMPFVLADLFSLAGILILLSILKNIKGVPNKKPVLPCIISGILFGLGMLSWSATAFIYLPLVLFAFLSLSLSKSNLSKLALSLSALCFIVIIIICLPWYLPIILKYGINPHSQEMAWFMGKFTVLHQVKPLNFYILTSGIPIFFVPVVFLGSFFKRSALNIFFIFWIILGAVATYTGWRGYVATIPIISAIAISVGLSWIVRFLFKEESKGLPVVFIIIFLLVGGIGYHISRIALSPLDPKNPNEVRTNENSIKMLQFLKTNYPKAITVDHITWMSEDEAVGSLRMVAGQYLEYLPAGSSEALKDTSRIYLADEENAYKICRKYNTDLIILRRQLLQLPQLAILFAPPELKSEDYFRVTKESPGAGEASITFIPRGMQTMLFQMLTRQKLKRFELIYVGQDKSDPLPFVVVYKVRKDSL